MFKEVYAWNVADEIKKGHKVFMVFETENDIATRDAGTITLREWVKNNDGRDFKFLMVGEDE